MLAAICVFLKETFCAWQLKALCNQVGSYFPQRENFLLTPKVKRSSLKSWSLIREGLWKVEWGGQAMDFRIGNLARMRRFPRPHDGLRALAENAPRAEALATAWMGVARPFLAQLYALRRRVATVTVGLLAGLMFVHVMFGANGMIMYKKKRAEYESLQKRIVAEQKENEIYGQRIQALQADERAIEKEAREQLHYARPGELVFVPPTAPASPAPPVSHSAKK